MGPLSTPPPGKGQRYLYQTRRRRPATPREGAPPGAAARLRTGTAGRGFRARRGPYRPSGTLLGLPDAFGLLRPGTRLLVRTSCQSGDTRDRRSYAPQVRRGASIGRHDRDLRGHSLGRGAEQAPPLFSRRGSARWRARGEPVSPPPAGIGYVAPNRPFAPYQGVLLSSCFRCGHKRLRRHIPNKAVCLLGPYGGCVREERSFSELGGEIQITAATQLLSGG